MEMFSLRLAHIVTNLFSAWIALLYSGAGDRGLNRIAKQVYRPSARM
jgi:hypothetical protein